MSEILWRSSTIADVDTRKRQIDLIAVPWDQEADVLWRGEIWREVFKRGSFGTLQTDLAEHRRKILVNREHVKGDTVGKLEAVDPDHPEGLWARVKIFSTARGDDTLTLADEDGIGASVGYRAEKSSDVRVDRPSRLRTVLNAWLDHLGMVEDPTWSGARVLATREDSSGLLVADGPLPDTPILDEVMSDPILAWARDRVRIS